MLDSLAKENSQSVQDCLPTIFVLKKKSKDPPTLESGLVRKSGSWQLPGDKAGLRSQSSVSWYEHPAALLTRSWGSWYRRHLVWYGCGRSGPSEISIFYSPSAPMPDTLAHTWGWGWQGVVGGLDCVSLTHGKWQSFSVCRSPPADFWEKVMKTGPRKNLLTWGVSVRGEKAQFQGSLRSSPANKMAWGLENDRKDKTSMIPFTWENSRQVFISIL